jgi:dienelactone hydrolase
MIRVLCRAILLIIAAMLVTAAAALMWLRRDAGRSLEDWFDTRHGELLEATVLEASSDGSQQSALIRLASDSGLQVTLRTIRKNPGGGKLPVLVIVGGHRTGSNAARLFPEVGDRAVVALDYPYTGPEKVRGLLQIARTVPLARQAFRDTPPAIMLTMDWLQQQDWVDSGQIIIVGASLGVPFAALAAARDPRIDGAFLVHGAADNELWLEAQVARRTEAEFLHKPFAVLLHWLAYGPTFDTRRNIAAIAPRPVLIIGARHDERTPAGQTELLFVAAEQPKWLRWTEGTHIQPDRMQVIDELLRIADEMLPFPQGPAEDP